MTGIVALDIFVVRQINPPYDTSISCEIARWKDARENIGRELLLDDSGETLVEIA